MESTSKDLGTKKIGEDCNCPNKKFTSFEIKEINLHSKLTCISSLTAWNLMAIGDVSGRISFYDNRVNKATKLFMSQNKKDIKYNFINIILFL